MALASHLSAKAPVQSQQYTDEKSPLYSGDFSLFLKIVLLLRCCIFEIWREA